MSDELIMQRGDYRMNDKKVDAIDIERAVAQGIAVSKGEDPRRISGNSYQIDTVPSTYPYGGYISPQYSNPNRIAMKHSMSVISAGLRFTINEVMYFLQKSKAPVDTEVKIIDVYNPDKPDVLEGQRLVLEWTSV